MLGRIVQNTVLVTVAVTVTKRILLSIQVISRSMWPIFESQQTQTFTIMSDVHPCFCTMVRSWHNHTIPKRKGVFGSCFYIGFLVGFWRFAFCLLVSQTAKKVFGKWLLSQKKATPVRFFCWLLACWPTFSLINSQQSILKFTKHLHKEPTFLVSFKSQQKQPTFLVGRTSQLKKPKANSQRPIAKYPEVKWKREHVHFSSFT